jgi:hypothetical protein
MKDRPLSNAVRGGIMVDLDALFDTRLAILDELDPLLSAYVLENGYFKREEDNFGVCNFELFKKLYKARDLNTLAKSRITNVLSIVLDFANDYIKQHGAKRTPNIYINTYPYRISSHACGDILKPLYNKTNGKANIHLVYTPPEELTVDVCKKNLAYIIKYDFMDWLISLGKQGDILKTPMNEITLIAPRLYQSGKPANIEETFSRNKMEPYRCAEVFFSQYVKLELLVPELFSAALDPLFIEEYLKEIELFQQTS